MLNKFQ